MPAASKAVRMANRVVRIGDVRPFSKSRTVLRLTAAAFASLVWDHPRKARPARNWAGVMVT